MKSHTCSFTRNTMTEIVMPNDTNPLGNLMGGNLLKWMDIASSISVMKHTNCLTVTAAVDSVSFREPIHLGDLVVIESFVTRVFKSSLEVYLEVFKRKFDGTPRIKSNSAYYTFVAIDKNGKPIPAAEVIPETEKEKNLYAGAKRRRELRLILGGRMKPEDATELKALFDGGIYQSPD